jgi:hypothetical protein
VLVTKIDDYNTRVYVHSAKKSKYQITGKDEHEFANAVFQRVTEVLEKKEKMRQRSNP